MTKKKQILFDLLKNKGIEVDNIWYYPAFGWHSGGWFYRDLKGDEYHLGDNFDEALQSIDKYY